MNKFRHAALLLSIVLAAGILSQGARPAHASLPPAIPVLAHYYIWFDPGSWDRAKTDEPVLGPYSSDDPGVIRQHILWAKNAGIDGFIVSWKSTDVLNRRLATVVKIAEEENFKLAITYQGLDFERDPLPVERIVSDLQTFTTSFAASPAFQLFDKPLVVLSGTPQFSSSEIEEITAPYRDSLTFLASERDPADYARVAGAVDGELYYWSSADPTSDAGYKERLQTFAATVRAAGGLWIAPAAPGFDARLVGGSRVVERKGGEVLRESMAAAAETVPDAIGIISWNEFSENTYIEPSKKYGEDYLNVVAELEDATPAVFAIDSSDSGDSGWPYGLIGLGALGSVVFLCLGILMVRMRLTGGDEDDGKINQRLASPPPPLRNSTLPSVIKQTPPEQSATTAIAQSAPGEIPQVQPQPMPAPGGQGGVGPTTYKAMRGLPVHQWLLMGAGLLAAVIMLFRRRGKRR